MEVFAYRSLDVPRLAGLQEYVDQTAVGFCPHLTPSMKFLATTWSVYTLEPGSVDSLSRQMFLTGVAHAEEVRKFRRSASRGPALHACDNIVFRFDSEDSVDGRELFAWPHWLLKRAYTKQGLMFGKFWKGEVEHSRDGRPLPIPPFHLFSVRSAMKKKDGQFFSLAEWMRPELETSEDDGGWPFSAPLNEDLYDREKEIARLELGA